ncbi:MAG: hypothetical protein U0359_30070 [Byssovorax sp.]
MPTITPLPLDSPAIHLDVTPGGEIVLRGAYELSGYGTVIDAATVTQPGASPAPGGLFDLESGGFHLTSRDLATHEVHLIATGDTGQACAALGVASPCLPVRAQKLALDQLMPVGEWKKALKGGISVEVIAPPAYAPPPAAVPYLEVGAGLAAAVVTGALFLRWRKKQAASPQGRLLSLARQVEEKLARADAVLAAPLAPAVKTAMKALRDRRVDAASGEGKRIAAVLTRVDARLDEAAHKARADKEQQAADELLVELEAALEAADEANLTASPAQRR